MHKPIRVGITHGDINGISYEVIMKALKDDRITELLTPVVFGSSKVFNHYENLLNFEGPDFNIVASASDVRDGRVNLVNITNTDLRVEPGKPTEISGHAALLSIVKACESLEKGEIDVLVTAPINKHAIHSEEFNFPGHTEYLEDRFAADGEKALMVLFAGDLRTALVTSHVSVAEVSDLVTTERVEEAIERFDAILRRDFRIDRPKIAVMSLDPHCGDMGVIGSQDDHVVRPAIDNARTKGFMAFGPFAADGLFGSEEYKNFDGVLAMYHDQGLGPFKALARGEGINFTGGLKYVRTSPDHGTGYDIAAKGLADPESMRRALYGAVDILRARSDFEEARRNPLKPLPEKSKPKADKAEKADSPAPSDGADDKNLSPNLPCTTE